MKPTVIFHNYKSSVIEYVSETEKAFKICWTSSEKYFGTHKYTMWIPKSILLNQKNHKVISYNDSREYILKCISEREGFINDVISEARERWSEGSFVFDVLKKADKPIPVIGDDNYYTDNEKYALKQTSNEIAMLKAQLHDSKDDIQFNFPIWFDANIDLERIVSKDARFKHK